MPRPGSSLWRVKYSSPSRTHTCAPKFTRHHRSQVLKSRLPDGFELSELSELVFGLQPWDGLPVKEDKERKCILM